MHSDDTEVILSYPAFFTVKEFADLTGRSESHIQHAARNFIEPTANSNRAQLPEGWMALRWSKVYILYNEQDHNKMLGLFSFRGN